MNSDTFPIFPKNKATNQFTEDFTYVNCNACHEISVSDFVDLMDKGEVRLLQGNFTEPDMKMIAKGVLASTEIARELKALFK